jgi:endonuclease YncB( thermonuclease family)
MLRAGMRTLFTISGVLLASAGLPACADESSSEEDAPGARVTRVIDGDTVVMERLGQVRLIGVNARSGNAATSAPRHVSRETA